uniref:Uncharacterized protein n=1 Tax=Magallana gigas TaxID=29159 RepID=A0A8W8KG44_MAGGI
MTSESKTIRKAGQLLLEGAVGRKSISEKEKRDFYHFIANALTEDEVGKEVLKDNSFLDLGASLFEKLGKQRASKIGKAIKERDTILRQEATDFIALHEVEWTEKISSIAHQITKQKRFNKKDMLSVTEDVISLQKFLDTKLREYTALLNTDKNI